MTLALLTKSQLQIINRRSDLRYPLDAAEKDYFLALVSKIIYESPLKEKLVFKGGTALHHTYLPQLRFSEDLDFTAISQESILRNWEIAKQEKGKGADLIVYTKEISEEKSWSPSTGSGLLK